MSHIATESQNGANKMQINILQSFYGVQGYNDPYFIQYSLSDNTCQLPANQDYRRLPGRSHRMYQVHGTLGDVIEVKASWKTPQTMILSPVIRQLVSPILLTLRKTSLKSNKTSQMSLNRRNWDRNRDRCHGIVEIVTEVLMVIAHPSTQPSSAR